MNSKSFSDSSAFTTTSIMSEEERDFSLKMRDIIGYFVLVSLWLQGSSGRTIAEVPVITVGGWLDKELDSQWNHNSKPPLHPSPFRDAISVSSSVQGMSLICNASYPIEWRFHHERWNWKMKFQYAVQTTRISSGLDVVSFSSELSFLGGANGITANYICQKVGTPNLSSSLFVFWEGSSPPYLTLAHLYRKPPQIAYRRESRSFTLPCIVSVPSVIPILSKEVGLNLTEVKIPLNNSVKYDPRYGFTLTDLMDPYGRYTCQVGDAEEEGDGDIINFIVVDADDTSQMEFNDTLRHGAYYQIDSKTKEVKCCSAGDKPPKLRVIECDHPTICAVRKHALHSMESLKKKNGSCSSIQLVARRAGIFRCKGAGVDVVREFFYPMPELPRYRHYKRGHGKKNDSDTDTDSPDPNTEVEEPYYNWYEADSSKMMQVTKLSAPVYIGETLNLTCKVSHFYYAKGIVWAIVYTNQSVEYLNGNYEIISRHHDPFSFTGRARHFQILYGRYQSFIEVTIAENHQAVICYAPVWNSTEWGKKPIEMQVQKPTPPGVIGRSREDHSWFLNDTDKFLVCKFDGVPVPNITWVRNNETISNGKRIQDLGNGTSKLIFRSVSVRVQNSYECRASNVAGNATKKFRITVIHSASSILMVVSTVSVMGLVFVVVASIFLCRYLKSQRSVMRRLANMAFKDVTNNANNVNANGDTRYHTSSNGIPQGNPHATGNTVANNRRNNIDSGHELSIPDISVSPSTNDPVPVDPGGYHKL